MFVSFLLLSLQSSLEADIAHFYSKYINLRLGEPYILMTRKRFKGANMVEGTEKVVVGGRSALF